MKILHISDTHNQQRNLGQMPKADVVVHSGDFTMGGSDLETLEFIEWFCNLPYKHKIFIAGNHDDCLFDATIEGLPDDVHYLHDCGIAIDGVLFYGVPMLSTYINGKFQSMEHYNLIPDNVDVLITHRPPLGILDGTYSLHYGSAALLDRVSVVKPRLHLFGHSHNAQGLVRINSVCFSNAAMCNDDYQLAYTPMLIEI